jgi:glutamate/aspartate transport system substrate-binding protein
VAQGTTNERAVKAAIEEQGLDIEILNVKDLAEGMLALETDRVDAWASDHVLLHGNIAKARNPEEFAVAGEFLSFDPYALMIRRDDSAFKLVGNKVLAELFRSGEILDMYAQWFDPLGIELTDTLKTAFQIQALPE